MALELCEAHATQLKSGFAREKLTQFQAKTAEELLEKLKAGRITRESFDPVAVSGTMMAAALSEYYQLPPEALAFTHPECPACQIATLGNPEVIEECIQACQQEAIRLGLLKAN